MHILNQNVHNLLGDKINEIIDFLNSKFTDEKPDSKNIRDWNPEETENYKFKKMTICWLCENDSHVSNEYCLKYLMRKNCDMIKCIDEIKIAKC